MIACVECLTLRTWVQVLLPFLVRRRRAASHWYVIDASGLGLAAARVTGWLLGAAIEPLAFRIGEVRDEQGRSIWLRILYQDLPEIHTEVIREPAFHALGAQGGEAYPRLPFYLAKVVGVATSSVAERQTLWRALLMIQLCAWKTRREAVGGGRATCFLERRPWDAAVARYASAYGITCVPIPPTRPWRSRLTAMLPSGLRHAFRDLRRLWQEARRRRAKPSLAEPRPAVPERDRIAVEYYGHLNLDDPALYSNLFFWQQSSLPAERLLVTFNLPQAPLDDEKWTEVTRHGMSAIALSPEATTLPWASACVPATRSAGALGALRELVRAAPARERLWAQTHLHAYAVARNFWIRVFASQRVKIHVSWFRMNETPCAIADALQHLGGITASYQRSFETHPSPQLSTAADIVFCCSPMTGEVERRSGSAVPYMVVTGYLGDHRAALWRAPAQGIRQRLRRQGAERILAFCDENSHDDTRWALDHALTREAYAFLLERVLNEPGFGLLLKPKTPHTLRKRLGPVAALLARAEATGRCVMFEGGEVQGPVPPVAAALAADVLVHGHLWAATAGVESALTGVPTLLMDREGWSESPFYRLGVGRVVFTDWPSLWSACTEHWARAGGIPGFGDWSSMLPELDPFRDGRAAERMGTYLRWLLEGFDQGWDREKIMAVAAERYAARWGTDTIIQINASRPTTAAPRESMADAPAEPVALS